MLSQDFKDAFLSIVKLGIGHYAGIPNQSVNWNTVEALAEQQGLLAILVDAVEQLPADQRPPQTLLLQWIGKTYQEYETRYEEYCHAIADLAAWYNKHGYKMLLLKGLCCGMDWPKPQHRPYGDIDIWLFGKQKEADEALGNWFKGLRVRRFKIDQSHHHHTVFNWQGFMIENHYDFINVHHHKSNVKFEAVLKGMAEDDSHFVMISGQKVFLPSPNLNALFLLKHMMAHFAAEGITLRQVLDWGFFVKVHKDEVDWAMVETILDCFGMKKMYDIFNAICLDELGFDLNLFRKIQYSPMLKDSVLNDILAREFLGQLPKNVFRRVPYKYRRWKANAWKHELCYNESMSSSFWSGVWNHILKPSSI